jgi:hypothetical protein
MDVFLFLHLSGAVATAIVACVALGSRLFSVTRLRAESVSVLMYASAFQVLTGTLLAVRSPETSAWAACQSLLVYLALVAFALLASRALDHRFIMPRRPLGIFLASCAILLSVAAIGL